jgi:hypothetical protein
MGWLDVVGLRLTNVCLPPSQAIQVRSAWPRQGRNALVSGTLAGKPVAPADKPDLRLTAAVIHSRPTKVNAFDCVPLSTNCTQ